MTLKHCRLPYENSAAAQAAGNSMGAATYVTRPLSILLGIALLCVAFIPVHEAWADIEHFFNISSTNYCSNTGTAFIASTIICEFLDILDSVLFLVYKNIQGVMQPVVRAMLTLYIAVFGAQLLMGTAHMQARDILGRLMMIAAVWTFSTQADYGIGIAFNFYMGLIADAGQAMVNSLGAWTDVCSSNGSFYDITVNNTGEPSGLMPLFWFFDQLIYCAFAGPVTSLFSTKVTGFFLAMAVIYPPMFGVFTWWAMTTAATMAKVILSFLTTLAAIAFLITLSPIFLSLMLFQVTSQFFNNWLNYLTSYSVQIILTLGIAVVWIIMMLKFVYFFSDLGNLIFPYEPSQVVGAYLNKTNTWAICYPDFSQIHPVCDCTNFDKTDSNWCDPYPKDQDPVVLPSVNDLIPPSKVIENLDLSQYIFYNLIALLILSYAFTKLMDLSGEIAGGITNTGAPLPSFQGGFGMKGMGGATGWMKQRGLEPAPPTTPSANRESS